MGPHGEPLAGHGLVALIRACEFVRLQASGCDASTELPAQASFKRDAAAMTMQTRHLE